MRTVAEWIGSSDDAPVPARVKLRIYDAAKGHCANCGQKVIAGEYDHIKRLKDGGENRETNLQLLCRPCHAAKSAQEQHDGAKIDRTRKKHLGIKSKSRNPIPGSRDSGWKRRLTSEGPRTERR